MTLGNAEHYYGPAIDNYKARGYGWRYDKLHLNGLDRHIEFAETYVEELEKRLRQLREQTREILPGVEKTYSELSHYAWFLQEVVAAIKWEVERKKGS